MRRYLGLLVLALVLAGCGGTDAGSKPKPAVTTAASGLLQLRGVTGIPVTSCPQVEGNPDATRPALACDADGTRYQLAPAAWEGRVKNASAGIPKGQVEWTVTVSLDAAGSKALAQLSSKVGERVAILLDGKVLAAPTFRSRITSGQLQIGGSFTEETAQALADQLTGG
jgi:preprotein translocase subunit SecD